MRICLLGNVPLHRMKDAFIREGHAVYECGQVHEWARGIEDRESAIYEFAPEAILVLFDVGFSELTMIPLAERDGLVAKLRECFHGVPVVAPYMPRLCDAIGLTSFYDMRTFKAGKEPFADKGVQAVVENFEAMRKVHSCRAIAVADDDTIWAGGLRDKKCKDVGKCPGFTKELRRFMEAGIPVVIVSHNQENDVARALTRWGMGVKYEYFKYLSCGHRIIKGGLDDVCMKLDLNPDDLVFISGVAEDRALANSFYPRMVIPPSRHDVNLTTYLRDVVAHCFPEYSVCERSVEKELRYIRRRESEAASRWAMSIQQFRDKTMPISLSATQRKRGEYYEDIERLKGKAELRAVNFCVTRTESDLVPVFWWNDFRAWYVTASVGKCNHRVFMASVVAGIRNGKANITDFLLNQEFRGYTIENAIMNYVRDRLLFEGVELIGFHAGYGFDKTELAVEIENALAIGYGRDPNVSKLPTYCKWV